MKNIRYNRRIFLKGDFFVYTVGVIYILMFFFFFIQNYITLFWVILMYKRLYNNMKGKNVKIAELTKFQKKKEGKIEDGNVTFYSSLVYSTHVTKLLLILIF